MAAIIVHFERPPTMEGTAPKDKTKAKQRYLKRKKERRKINKNKTSAAPKPRLGNEEGSEEEEEEEEEEAAADVTVEEVQPLPEEKTEKRPKKRRRISTEPEDAQEPEPILSEPPEAPVQRSPTPQAALPRFPLPTLPNAPSKTALALQGLDQALVDAEIVAPSKLLSIPTDGEEDGGTGLSEKMRRRLHDLGITELFAVQTSLLPFLLPPNPMSKALYQPYNPPRDVCVSAPTGSGKTLAYALPIVEILSSRIVTRLRALVILPTRDLVMQVRETFEAISKGRGLKIGTATGQHSFPQEQAQLVADHSSSLQGGSSKVDILICTPGRLIDHLKETPNFSLQHLRFLVVDEADRLLAQSFQDWLIQVLAATRPPRNLQKHTLQDLAQLSLDPSATPKSDALSPAFLHLLPYPDVPSFVSERKESSCQKLLFSATLTRDPGKIAALELRNPKYFVVHGSSADPDQEGGGVLDVVTQKFTMPATLKEHMVVCSAYEKPLVFFHLVYSHHVSNALVFTKSADSTNRLVRLFEFFEEARRAAITDTSDSQSSVVRAQAYSSDLGAAERKSILDKFKAKDIQILVCSDLISRGIDISHVSHVVSYDSPVDIRKYVHRVGRTARAGREGDAWTLVEEQEARHFKIMMKEANHLSDVKRLRLGEQELSPLAPYYETALSKLKELYSRS